MSEGHEGRNGVTYRRGITGTDADADGDGVADEGEGQTRTANDANEIGAITGRDAAEPAYDAAGNMTFDGRQHYVYDAWNRMVAAYANDDGDLGNQIACYEYDGRGYRTAKAVALYADAEHPATVTGYDRTDFFYNKSWQAVEQRLAANCPSPAGGGSQGEGVATDYVWDQSYIDTPVLRIRSAGQSSESLYYTVDANKNVTALVDPTDGSVAERYTYSPYGQATTYSDDWTSTVTWENSQQNDRQYCGYVLDAETALNYVRHRYYDSSMGVWISRDPAGYTNNTPERYNLHAYCYSLPTVLVDASGLKGSVPYFSHPVKPFTDKVFDKDSWKPENQVQTLQKIDNAVRAVLVDKNKKPLTTVIDVMDAKGAIGDAGWVGTSGWYCGYTIQATVVDGGDKDHPCWVCDFADTAIVFASWYAAFEGAHVLGEPVRLHSQRRVDANGALVADDRVEDFAEANASVTAHETFHVSGIDVNTRWRLEKAGWKIAPDQFIGYDGAIERAWVAAVGLSGEGPLMKLIDGSGEENRPKDKKDSALCEKRLRDILSKAGFPMVNDIRDANVGAINSAGFYHTGAPPRLYLEADWLPPQHT